MIGGEWSGANWCDYWLRLRVKAQEKRNAFKIKSFLFERTSYETTIQSQGEKKKKKKGDPNTNKQ